MSEKNRTDKSKNKLLLILIGIIIALVLTLIIILAILMPKKDAVPASLGDAVNELETTSLTSIELSKLTEQVGELTTQKYYYKDIYEEKTEKDGFFGSEELTLIVYEGTIHAGIDLNEIDYEIDNEAQKIMVSLPELKILSHEFENDKVKSYDVKKKMFSKGLSYEDSAQKFDEIKKLKEEAVLEDEEFLESVMEDTKTALTSFFTISDLTKDYEIEFIENIPEKTTTKTENSTDTTLDDETNSEDE